MGRTKGWTGELSRFGKYLQTHNVSRQAIAAGCGITSSYISMLAHGKAAPGFGLARRIEAWTRANVPLPVADIAPEARVPAPFTCGEWETDAPAPVGDETAAA